MKLSGQGIGMFTIKLCLHDAEQAVYRMQRYGIRAALTQRADAIQKTPPSARFVSITPLYIIFKDNRQHPLLTIDRTSDILIVLADISGVFRDMAISDMAYKGAKHIPFQQAIRKAAPFVFQPAADIFLLDRDAPVRGVRIDSKHISYAGLDETVHHLSGKNFPGLIRRIMTHVQNCLTDHYFGLAGLPGAKPDRQTYKEDKQSIERMFIRYENYVLTAAKHGLILPETWTDLNDRPPPVSEDNHSDSFSPSEIRQIFIPETGIPEENTQRLRPIIVWGAITICALALPFVFFMKQRGAIYLMGGVIAAVSLILAGAVLSLLTLKRLRKRKKKPELPDPE
jgi:hypothetical protein